MDKRSRFRKDQFDWAALPSFDETPYPSLGHGSRASLASLPSNYSFSVDPREWGTTISTSIAEPDDEQYLVPPGRKPKREYPRLCSLRGLLNAGCLLLLLGGMLALFIGYPVIVEVTKDRPFNNGGSNLGGINRTGQVPEFPASFRLIDADTPMDAYSRVSWQDNKTEFLLVFSDEFNTDGRSFYPGDDPFWEAADLHYWATDNMEWYDPEAVTTKDGSLVITLSRKRTHDMDFQGGMISSWNKFCFTGGYIEASVSLPGANNILGLWPAIWTMGNLGRAGYGASLEGLWPYSYDSCDVGTVKNQTVNGVPLAATINGDPTKNGALSFLPGQRLSRCTCSGESHPGPKHRDGTFVGRSAPEIDVFEAQIDAATLVPGVSQSAQWAPFNGGYAFNTSSSVVLPNPARSHVNDYVGSATQQATSVITFTDLDAYEMNGGKYAIYGFEYKPGFDEGYITWISGNQVGWTLFGPTMGADTTVAISNRIISQEPMYMILNLGISRGFGHVDLENLRFPAHLKVDYVRVYQPKHSINVGCNPKDFPTQAYIERYKEAYTNPNLTTWVDDYNQPWPKNSFLDQC